MPAFPLLRRSTNKAAALIIVLAFVVLLTGLSLVYFSRTTTERQLAQSSYNDTSSDILAGAAVDVIVGDLRAEIVDGSVSPAPSFACVSPSPCNTYYVYLPTPAANMLPQKSGNVAGAPNLIRRSVAVDQMQPPGRPSRASAVSSAPLNPANPNRGDITKARWNKHYLVPKLTTTDDSTEPIAAFVAPDWVFVTGQGPTPSPSPSSVIGRYAYAVYDEGGLLDMNVAGYPTDPSGAPVPVQRVGRKGSLAYADLTALASSDVYRLGNPDAAAVYQVDRLVGWRNYVTTQPTNNFPATNFAANFQSDATRAAAYFTSIINNTNGFLSASTPSPSPSPPWNTRTDQMFIQRQELIGFRNAVGTTTSFSTNALQYLSTFSRETNAPSFSPPLNASEMGGNDQGGLYAYRTNAANPSATPINPNFLFRRVTNSFTRFDGTTALVGEPLVKTRFPLSRLAWITYKGPSASLASSDPVYQALYNALVNGGYSAASATSTIAAGTAANIKACFGLMFGGNQTVGDPSNPWVYTNPTGAVTSPANRIMRLDEVAAVGREPDFFELLQAGILSGSLGQSTAPPPGTSGGGTTGGNPFPDVHMSSTIQHLLTVGASIIDQADPDSIPTRIQFKGTNSNTWTAYGVENLPYITQMYPIAGTSPNASSKWATYLLFQLWNPHQSPAGVSNNVRLRIDGGIGIFAGGNGQSWTTTTTAYLFSGLSIPINGSFSVPTPLYTNNGAATTTGDGTAIPGIVAYLPLPSPAPTPPP